MKISQEVRDFARMEAAKGDTAGADEGMREMSEKFVASGGEMYQRVG